MTTSQLVILGLGLLLCVFVSLGWDGSREDEEVENGEW
jgi:hypothetical protein